MNETTFAILLAANAAAAMLALIAMSMAFVFDRYSAALVNLSFAIINMAFVVYWVTRLGS